MKKIVCFILIAVFSLSLCGSSSAAIQGSQVTMINAAYKNLWLLGSKGTDASSSKVTLFEFQKGKYRGIINEKGKVIADAIYDGICNYQYGLITVVKNNKFGIINNKGKVIVKPKYDNIADFHDGLACVRLNKKYGFINMQGSVIIPIEFESAFDFAETVAPVCKEGKWGLINKKGAIILKPTYAQIGYTRGDENDIKVSFVDGIAPVKASDGKWGYIDKTGKEIIKPQFDAAYASTNGFASMIKNDKMGLVDSNGIVLEPTYTSIGDFNEYGIGCYCENDKLGYISHDLRKITEAQYEALSSSPQNGYYLVYKDNKWGVLDQYGNTVIEPQYDKMGSFYHGLAYVVINGKIGYINIKNELVIPAKFNKTSDINPDFTFGNAIAVQNGKYGLINTKGTFIVNPTYKLITKDTDNNMYITQLGNSFGVLDSKGKVILKPYYSDIKINNNIICAAKGSSARLYYPNGKALTKNSYDIMSFENQSLTDTSAAYIYKKNGRYGAILVKTK